MGRVAVVVLDALRYDAFRERFDWLDGLRFRNAYSTSHWTIPAHASLLSGRYASEIGVHAGNLVLDWPGRTLPEALQADGYRTVMFSANGMLHSFDGWERGFAVRKNPAQLAPVADDSIDWWRFNLEHGDAGPGKLWAALVTCVRSEHSTVASLRTWREIQNRPPADGGAASVLRRLRATEFPDDEFLFVNLMETHVPWYTPADPGSSVRVNFAGAVVDSDVPADRYRRAYRESVAMLSETYEEIHRELVAEFDWVVTLSDHGELLGEAGLWSHEYSVRPELVRVPLVVSGDRVESTTVDVPVNLLDVHRTVAERYGLDVDSDGRDLLSDPEPRHLLTEYHGAPPGIRDIIERRTDGDDAYDYLDDPLFGLVEPNGAYSYQTHRDGFNRDEDSALADPEAKLADLRSSLDRRAADPARPAPDEVRARLADLGYASADSDE